MTVLPACRALCGVLITVSLATVLMLLAAPDARAAVSATPATFIAGWGGEINSSTQLTWTNPTAGRVRVLVAAPNGTVRRVLVDGFQSAGAQSISWNGSDAVGEPLASGRYVVRIERTTNPVTAKPQRAQRYARAAAHSAAETTVVQLQAAPLAIRTVKLVRGAIGMSAARSSIVGTYAVTAPATVAAAVVDAQGRIVRSLQSGTVRAGSSRLTWNGRTAAGRPVADGAYTLLLSAASSGRPTGTVRTPLRVDRHAPKLSTAKAVRAATSRVRVLVPLRLGVSEASTISVRSGRKSVKWQQTAGTRSVRLTGSALGIAPMRRARVVRVRVNAADSTGNLATRVLSIVVPAVRTTRTPTVHDTTPPPAQTPTPPPPTSSTGKLLWPVSGGVVTSGFGARGGRMHEGIDIGVPIGTSVHASAAGTVISAGTSGGYGIQVTIQHANGLTTRYAHFTAVAAALVVGDTVTAGQLIGLSGCTGSCTGPHVHYETRRNGIAVNPRLYLP